MLIGIVYTWFVGNQKIDTALTEESTPTQTIPIKRAEVDPNARVSASVQSLTSPIVPGDNASIIVKTNAGSWCTITAVYDKTASKDSGLVGKTADDFGSVTWTWTVEASVPLGKWPITVTCVRNKLSAVVIGELIVQKTLN